MEKGELNVKQMMEQMGGSMEDLAGVVGSYYHALLKEGVPVHLADQLLLEWHNIYFGYAMRPRWLDDPD